jgi:hypothetical protein
MKKAILTAVTYLALSQTAHAALLETEVVQGLKKVCIYSDGSAKTISSVGICPLSN